MTPRERVIAALNRQHPDKTPKYAEFTPFVEKMLYAKTGAEDLQTCFNVEIGPELRISRPISTLKPDPSSIRIDTPRIKTN